MVQDQHKDYDIDDGVYFHKDDLQGPKGGEKTALDAKKMVRKALHDDRFKMAPEVRTNCVRVYYNVGYHVDVPVYRPPPLEVDLAIRTVRHPPLPDPPLQRPKLPRLKATRMTPAQRLEQRQHLQPAVAVGHQLRHHLRLPHLGERVLPRPPRPRRLRRRRQRAALPLSPRPLAHSRRRGGRRQRLPRHPFLSQSPNLRIRDQPVLREENGQCHTPRGRPRDRPTAASATGKNNCR